MKINNLKNELDGIKKREEKMKQRDFKNEPKKYIYDFQQYETIRSFGDSIYPRKINIVEGEEGQRNLLNNIVEFDNKSRPRSKKA